MSTAALIGSPPYYGVPYGTQNNWYHPFDGPPEVYGPGPSFKTMLCVHCGKNPIMVEVMYGIPKYDPECLPCMMDLAILNGKEW